MSRKERDITLPLSERDFASQVETLLDLFGWTWCHFRPAQTKHGWRTPLSGSQGLPDYIAARPPWLILFELKSDKGILTDKQKEWHEILKACHGCEVYLWRPGDIEVIADRLSQHIWNHCGRKM